MTNEKFVTPRGQTIFDWAKENYQDLILEQGANDWGEEGQTAICRVLRVWKVRKSDLKNTWADKALTDSGRGRSDVVLFQGRIISNKGQLGLHSAIPDPLVGAKGALGAPDPDGDMDFWIDLHPIFVGLLGKNQPPKANDYIEVEFNKAYARASGEWYGVVKSFAKIEGNGSYGSSPVPEISPKKPFEPDAREFEEQNLGPQPPANVPRRFLFVGDEMFGTSAQLINRSTSFAKKIQGDIRDLYSTLRSLNNNDSPTAQEQIKQKLQMQFDMPDGLVKALVKVFSDSPTAIPIPDFWNISVAFVDPTFYSTDGSDFYAPTVYGKTKGSVVLDLPGNKLKFNDASPSEDVDTVKHGSALIEKVLETKSPFWTNEVESETGWNGDFDFAIIGGPMGYSANPGWAGVGTMPPKYAAYAKYAWPYWGAGWDNVQGTVTEDGDEGLTTKHGMVPDYERLQEYVRQIARFQFDEFVESKQKHYKNILDALKKKVKGTIWVGPGLAVERGRVDIEEWDKVGLNQEKVAVHTEYDIGGYPNIERHKLRVLNIPKNKHQAAGVQYTYSPYYDPAFHLRWATSTAILNATKDDKRAYPCLAYCSKYYDLEEIQQVDRVKYDNIAKHYNISTTTKNVITDPSSQRAYSNWVIRMLCKYIANLDAPSGEEMVHIDAMKGTDAIIMGDFVKDAEFLDRWADDFASRYQDILTASEDIFGWQVQTSKLPDIMKDEIESMQTISKEIADQYAKYTKKEDDWWWSNPG